jgi:hypothetical protein
MKAHLPDICAEPICAETAEDEPKFDGAESSPETELPVSVIDGGRSVGMVCMVGTEEWWCHVECVGEVLPVPNPKGGRVKVCEAPLERWDDIRQRKRQGGDRPCGSLCRMNVRAGLWR